MKLFSLIFAAFLVLNGCSGNKSFNPNDDKVFVEIFHALEIYTRNSFNEDKAQYIDYIIQKHGLWKGENLKRYKRAKENLSLDSDRQNRLFLAAQDYQINSNWQKEYEDIEDNNKKDFLNYLKIENNDLYILMSDLLSDDKKVIEEAYKKIYNLKELPKINWDAEQKTLVSNTLRRIFRDRFEKEFLKYNS
jgi:hypothetical protein